MQIANSTTAKSKNSINSITCIIPINHTHRAALENISCLKRFIDEKHTDSITPNKFFLI